MFNDSGLLEKMASDFEIEILSRLDWDKGMDYQIKEN